MTRRRRWWLLVGAALIGAASVAVVVNDESAASGALVPLALLWVAVSFVLLLWRLWRWMTYRVGVRLFVSYLLIGLLPFLLGGAFVAVGLYILMGQYTSVRFGSVMTRERSELYAECRAVLDRVKTLGADEAASLLQELAATNPDPLPRVVWQARLDGRDVTLGARGDLPGISWVRDNPQGIVARHGGDTFDVVSAVSEQGDRVVALIPMDDDTARAISARWWFDVAFFPLQENGEGREQAGEEKGITVESKASRDGAVNFTFDGESVSGEQIWPPWTGEDQGVLSKPLIVWFRVVVDVVDLATGEPVEGDNMLALLRTSPFAVWRDFTLSRYELGTHIWGILAGLGLFFLVGYGLALAVAATIILSITRSVRRLSAGAAAVERGNLDHRVPVKRRDQLGDLARSFNHMTDSVQSMLSAVAEKERLAHELELAREIQESLLPARYLELGPVSVNASFQPAAEVGGDYFDVFPLADDRLVLAVGDVAGHGLHTGLLMASLKSSVAALVHEGYTGRELIDKANHLLLAQGRGRVMVTLSVVEVDPVAGRLELANSGHPPAFLIGPSGKVEELMAGSVPLGTRLCCPVSLTRTFAPGSRLFLYSDGLVEAVSKRGEPFGYDRLADVLRSNAGRSGKALIATILEALGEYTSGTPLADDLTLLVVERTS